MESMGENKRNFYTQDLMDWLKWTNIKFQYNTHFPLISVQALRMYLACPTKKLRDELCKFFFNVECHSQNCMILQDSQ